MLFLVDAKALFPTQEINMGMTIKTFRRFFRKMMKGLLSLCTKICKAKEKALTTLVLYDIKQLQMNRFYDTFNNYRNIIVVMLHK